MEHLLPSLNSSLRPLLHSFCSCCRFAKFTAVMLCAPENCSLIQEPTGLQSLVAHSVRMLPSYAFLQGFLFLYISELTAHDTILTMGTVARAHTIKTVADTTAPTLVSGIPHALPGEHARRWHAHDYNGQRD